MTHRQPDEVLHAVGAVHDRVSALASAIKEMVIAECLTTQTLQFPTSGIATFDWQGGFASLAITNLSAQAVTVTTQSPSDTAPLTGAGVAVVPANGGAAYNMAGCNLTLYGLAGDRITLSVFSRPLAPAWR